MNEPKLDLIDERSPAPGPETEALLKELFKYTEDRMVPWRRNFLEVVRKCYRFKELDQWAEVDHQALDVYGVPRLAVDRINRGLETIEGIRTNTGSRVKVVKVEAGDERVAELLDKTAQSVAERGDFEEVDDDCFSSLIDTGIGVRKVGFDPMERSIWTEFVAPEEFAHSRCKSKYLADINWCWQHSVMDWEEAAARWPEKAGEIKGLRGLVETEWNELNKTTTRPVTQKNQDYGEESGRSPLNGYPDMVHLWEFWLLRTIPYRKVGTVKLQVADVAGLPVQVSVPEIQRAPVDYQAGDGEKDLGVAADRVWEQYIVASSADKQRGILLSQGAAPDHPYIAYVAERKKDGAPRGYIEKVIPHQVRINLAWAQKVAFNNKSIKSPIVVRNVTDLDKIVQQSSIGTILSLTGTEMVENFNLVPQLNLQAIEEGNMARADMDFAAAATEGALTGSAATSESGIKMSLRQNAAITPLNKWVKAERRGKMHFYRKVLNLIIANFQPEEYQRIVGMQTFATIAGPKVDPVTGRVVEGPMPWPIPIDAVQYDVRTQDEGVSEFIKQQSFNATEALVSGGVPLDDEFRIKNAPIKNTDEALQSNQRAKNDVIKFLMAEVQRLSAENQQLQRSAPKSEGSQKGNAVTGKNAPQAGKRSMVGGQLGMR